MTRALPTGRNGRVLAVGFAALALAVLWLAIGSPLVGWYEARAAHLAERRLFAAHLAGLAAALPVLARDAHRLSASVPARRVLLEGATDAIAAANLQQTVQSMAGRAGAVISSTETLATQRRGRYRLIRLQVALTGRWPVLVHLLQAITTAQPTMLVDDLRVTGADIGVRGGDAPLSATITVIAFRPGTAHPLAMGSGSEAMVK
ncbi:type II secretion system protein GspM [Acidiphilium sp. PA]|uniref:type II secretion system protein GspM n=1 Tax=Acidiphilium sp. PA TaxID=2871705 RepID=UPI002243B66A|nr:type II secretion system protein GspM [Acidiphilium sp. PA]MCW8306047.1 type II secretion system protein GspM [Acidiphilium sp. PA]